MIAATIYGVAAVLLGASYGAFLLALLLGRKCGFRSSPVQELRLGKVVLVLALLVAPAATFLGKPLIRNCLFGDRTPQASERKAKGDYGFGLDRPDLESDRYRRSQTLVGPSGAGTPEETAVIWDLILSKSFGVLASAFGLGFLLFSARLFRRLRALFQLIEASLCLKQIGRIRVLISDEVAVPFSTFAFRRADVVIPSALLKSATDFKVAVRHELQHHRNGDTIWILAIELLILFFYWNPFVYLWKAKLEELLEFACDQRVLEKGDLPTSTYGKTLVRVAQNYLNQSTPEAIFSGTLGMAIGHSQKLGGKSLLHRRIQIMFNIRSQTQSRREKVLQNLFTGGIAVGSLLALASLMGGVTEATPAPGTGEKPIFHAELQQISSQALSDGIRQAKARSGVVIVTDPMDGRLLAASVYDGVSKGMLGERDSLLQILSTTDQPNSLIKPITAAYAIQAGKLKADEVIHCEGGSYQVGNRVFGDHTAFGNLTVAETIAHSSDIGAIKIAERLGAEELKAAFRAFGFGDSERALSPKLGKMEPGKLLTEATGSQQEFSAEFSNGQNALVNPLELMRAYGAIANGGSLVQLQPYQQDPISPAGIKKVLSVDTVDRMKAILERTIQDGTGTRAKLKHAASAGKTGTGILRELKLGVGQFIGFAPVQKPKLLIYVMVTGAEKQVWGGKDAAPIFREIAERGLKLPPKKALPKT